VKYSLPALFLLVVISKPILGQNENWQGFYNIRNFSPEEYDGHVQNWGIVQDSNQVIYVANGYGLLAYAGENWNILELPLLLASSISGSETGRIYIGSVDEFGFINNGEAQYHSLTHLVVDSVKNELGDVIDIISVGETAAFLTSGTLLFFEGDSIQVFKPKGSFYSLFERNNRIHVWDTEVGLLEVKKEGLSLMKGGGFFSEVSFFSYINITDQELFCSYRNCFRYDGERFIPVDREVDDYLAANYLDESVVLRDSTVLIGTRRGGIVQTDKSGKIILTVDESLGLINNVVLGVYEDMNGSVWVATNNGISRIDVSLPIKYFDERSSINESIYDIAEFGGSLFFASDTGVYELDKARNSIKEHGIGSFCSDLNIIKESLIANCGSQLFLYSDNQFKSLELELNARFFTKYDENHFIYGDGQDYRIVKLHEAPENVIYEFSETFPGINSSLVDENGILWMASTSRGLIKVEFVEEDGAIVGHRVDYFLTKIENQINYKRVYVTKLNNEPAFLTWGKGIQRYNYSKGELYVEQRFGSFHADTTRQYFLAEEDHKGNIWFRSGNEFQAAMLRQDGSYSIYQGALMMIDHRQINVIYPDREGFIWYGTDEGLVRFNTDHNFDHEKPFYTQINQVLVRNDSLINTGNSKEEITLDYRDNELRFTYAATSYFKPEETEYRVRLAGFEENWTAWTNEAQKDYTNIPEGQYSFKVQARNIFGVMSESDAFSFSVLPPWYRTWWAYLLYTVTISGILYLAYKIRINQILRVQRIRNNIASDLHDEVSATLSSISYFAEAIKSDKLKKDKSRFVDLIAKSADDAKEKITDIVWAINPEHDDWQAFLSKCRRFTSDLLESKEMEYSLKIDEFIPGKLDMQLRQHLWLIFKEMVTNAVRHSQATQLDVIMKYEDGKLKLVVQDNGEGMDVDNVQKGNGMVNIHKRAEQINGEISLKTSEGFGTRWMLKVPL
jgi:hypothetical protein